MGEVKAVERWRVLIMESESGWGTKVDETLYFDTEKEANEYVKNFNAQNTIKDHVPNIYWYAEKPVYELKKL